MCVVCGVRRGRGGRGEARVRTPARCAASMTNRHARLAARGGARTLAAPTRAHTTTPPPSAHLCISPLGKEPWAITLRLPPARGRLVVREVGNVGQVVGAGQPLGHGRQQHGQQRVVVLLRAHARRPPPHSAHAARHTLTGTRHIEGGRHSRPFHATSRPPDRLTVRYSVWNCGWSSAGSALSSDEMRRSSTGSAGTSPADAHVSTRPRAAAVSGEPRFSRAAWSQAGAGTPRPHRSASKLFACRVRAVHARTAGGGGGGRTRAHLGEQRGHEPHALPQHLGGRLQRRVVAGELLAARGLARRRDARHLVDADALGVRALCAPGASRAQAQEALRWGREGNRSGAKRAKMGDGARGACSSGRHHRGGVQQASGHSPRQRSWP